MAIPIQMPSLSPTMTEGKITKWLKKEGDKISSGEAIAEVETDKSNLEVEAYDDGFLLKIVVAADGSAPVGSPIAWIGAKGETVDASAASAGQGRGSEGGSAEGRSAQARGTGQGRGAEARAREAAGGEGTARTDGSADGCTSRHLGGGAPAHLSRGASHGARAGTGARRGRRQWAAGADHQARHRGGAQPAPRRRRPPSPASEKVAAKPAFIPVPLSTERREPEARPVSSMRKVISQRMAEVKPGVPHFYLTIDVEMDAAMKAREEAKALDLKVSVNDLIIKAAAVALRRSPKMNVTLQGDEVLHYSTVDIGIAVAIEDGLITPVVRDADQKGLATIAAESRDLAARARTRKLKPQEYTGGTLTVSNLGMFGIDNFIAVINPPHAAIIAVGQVSDKVVVRDGQMVVRKMMTATLSGDHRVIDGAVGAEYLRELKSLLEHPMRLLF